MEYNKYSYLWPPRPEKAIARPMIDFYEQRQFVAQIKMNGTCNVIAVSPERELTCMSRHKEPHKAWSPTAETVADFSRLRGKGWYVFVAELMHSKIPGIRNVNYVHDILVFNGDYLVGSTFLERQQILEDVILRGRKGKSRELMSHWEISPTLWLAKNFYGDFGELFDRLARPEHEGLVLKNPDARLAMCLRQTDNSNWQVKVRRPHKNYSF